MAMKSDEMAIVLKVSKSKTGVKFRYERVIGKNIYSIRNPSRRQMTQINNGLFTGSSTVPFQRK